MVSWCWSATLEPGTRSRCGTTNIASGPILTLPCLQHGASRPLWDTRTTSSQQYSAQPVPVGSHCMSSALVGDHWYLSSFGGWKDEKEHIFWAHLPTLISTAISTHSSPVWHELPTPPVERPALLPLRGHLLLVGGRGCVQELHRYDPDTEQWRECGKLPLAMLAPCVAVLPSGQLMVAGGKTGDTGTFSQRVWLGNIQS